MLRTEEMECNVWNCLLRYFISPEGYEACQRGTEGSHRAGPTCFSETLPSNRSSRCLSNMTSLVFGATHTPFTRFIVIATTPNPAVEPQK